METQQKIRIHPLAAGAAVAVIIAAGVGVAAMTGHLPGSNAESSAVAQYSAVPASQVPAVPVESAEHRAARDQGAREQAERDRVRQRQIAAAPQKPLAQATTCPNCGVVESVNAYQQHPTKSVVGMVGGGVVGALVGNQIGHGATNTVATVGGAAGGAYLGNEIGKKVQTTTRYNVVVRMDGGGSQTVSYAAQPGFSVGSHVRVENGTLIQN